jgi:hypothetical protein
MKRMITILATLFLLNSAYSQDYTGVDDAFFSSVQVILNNAKGQKISLDNTFGNTILGEQVFTSTVVSISTKQSGAITYTKYTGMDWMALSSPHDYTYRTSVDDNPKLNKLQLTFSFSNFKRYYFYKGEAEGDFLETTNIGVYFLTKDEYALLDILNSYKIYTRRY